MLDSLFVRINHVLNPEHRVRAKDQACSLHFASRQHIRKRLRLQQLISPIHEAGPGTGLQIL